MSFGPKLADGECRIGVGQVHTNGLQERFEEHRRVIAMDAEDLEFQVVYGRRSGRFGSCKVNSFWLWSRGPVEK